MAQRFNHPFGSVGGAPKAMAKAPAPMAGAEPEMGGEEDGSAVAAEHGPAHEVHITHDHAAGMHHVHSMHPDGHEHHSDHGSAEEAHEHAKKLASGEGMPQAEDDDWGEDEPMPHGGK